ncbi:autotransporter outer membrane beta-barrel domain-containing protein [Pseudomonas umsongensis]|nr:autotransporter outer membrane beta-barrel domain-containing protein [Pseudomonas umsongensis]
MPQARAAFGRSFAIDSQTVGGYASYLHRNGLYVDGVLNTADWTTRSRSPATSATRSRPTTRPMP